MTIAIIRIHGKVGVRKDIVGTLQRLNLKRKYSCIIIEKPTKEQLGMIKKIDNFVAYGDLNKETFEELVKKRGKHKSKVFFRLHPPRKGINSKLHFPRGVLGNNKDKINDLIVRML